MCLGHVPGTCAWDMYIEMEFEALVGEVPPSGSQEAVRSSSYQAEDCSHQN